MIGVAIATAIVVVALLSAVLRYRFRFGPGISVGVAFAIGAVVIATTCVLAVQLNSGPLNEIKEIWLRQPTYVMSLVIAILVSSLGLKLGDRLLNLGGPRRVR